MEQFGRNLNTERKCFGRWHKSNSPPPNHFNFLEDPRRFNKNKSKKKKNPYSETKNSHLVEPSSLGFVGNGNGWGGSGRVRLERRQAACFDTDSARGGARAGKRDRGEEARPGHTDSRGSRSQKQARL